MGPIAKIPPQAFQNMSPDTIRQLAGIIPQKRQRSPSPPGAPHNRQFAHISPHDSPRHSPPPIEDPYPVPRSLQRPTKKIEYDYSGMSPRSAKYYQEYGTAYQIPAPERPRARGRMGTSQEEVDAAIVRFIKPIVEEDPEWMTYMGSKGKPPIVAEILKQYRFVQSKVQELSDTRTPIHWDGAPGLEVERVSQGFVCMITSMFIDIILASCMAVVGHGITIRDGLR